MKHKEWVFVALLEWRHEHNEHGERLVLFRFGCLNNVRPSWSIFKKGWEWKVCIYQTMRVEEKARCMFPIPPFLQMCRQITTKCPRCGLVSDVSHEDCGDPENCDTVGMETRDLICDDCLKKEDEDDWIGGMWLLVLTHAYNTLTHSCVKTMTTSWYKS